MVIIPARVKANKIALAVINFCFFISSPMGFMRATVYNFTRGFVCLRVRLIDVSDLGRDGRASLLSHLEKREAAAKSGNPLEQYGQLCPVSQSVAATLE
jgi:hypothetical protein